MGVVYGARWLALAGAVILHLTVTTSHGRSLKRVTRAAETNDADGGPEFWQLNQYVCPPALCPNAGPGGGVSSDPSRNPIALPLVGSQGAGPRKVTVQQDFRSAPRAGWSPFFEGDIVRKSQLQPPSSSRRRGKRSIARPVTKLWPYGIVPYEVDPDLNSRAQNAIQLAIDHYHEKTCLRFRKRKTTDKDYIKYIGQPGCWSFVGRQGGEQLLSLGLGCEHFGTVVHETGHALGFWHEQSRLDRDKYIQILEDNISPYTMHNFGKMKTNETTSRGYAYDYNSIMHYGEKYFTKNGKPTIKIKKIGRDRNMKIGQRKALSDLDLAQLRAMYYCNAKDKEKRMCPDGWISYAKSCYKFVADKKTQFSIASKACMKEGAHLVYINSQAEDNFIKSHLISKYKKYPEWRTGGFRVKGKFVWYNPVTKKTEPMRYKKWAPNHPGSYSSMGLFLYNGSPPRFVWRGMWAGSYKQLPKYSYNYICEKNKKLLCFKSKTRGQDYRGTVDYTMSGVTCQRWRSQWPHSHSTFSGDRRKDEKNGLDHNYCRNPNGKRKRPWCYTNLQKKTWQYCDVAIC